MQPDIEQLFQIIKSVAESTPHDFIRVVLGSPQGAVRFVEVTENLGFRMELEDASREGFLALGFLGWELSEGMVQARSVIFPWHKDSKTFQGLFQRLCEDGVDRIKEEFERRSIN